MDNTVVAMQWLKACVTCQDVMSMADYMQKGTTTPKRFNNKSFSEGWYQACISVMIEKGILKSSSGTVTHDVTQNAWCTSSNLEASYIIHANELVKTGIDEYNYSYTDTVEVSEKKLSLSPHISSVTTLCAFRQLRKASEQTQTLSAICVHQRVTQARYCRVSSDLSCVPTKSGK